MFRIWSNAAQDLNFSQISQPVMWVKITVAHGLTFA